MGLWPTQGNEKRFLFSNHSLGNVSTERTRKSEGA
jgi:hypothetical protein